jgi:presenilin enhancer 2
MIGTVIWIAIIVTWVIIFQMYRADWGMIADNMSFIVPKGEL